MPVLTKRSAQRPQGTYGGKYLDGKGHPMLAAAALFRLGGFLGALWRLIVPFFRLDTKIDHRAFVEIELGFFGPPDPCFFCCVTVW